MVLLVVLACGVYARAAAGPDRHQSGTGGDAAAAVPFPTGYRTWTHVKSTLVGTEAPGFATNGGLHHFYANAAAVEGYRTGTFPDGATLIDERLATEERAGITREGARHTVSVMVRDRARFAATGGWGFEVFPKEERAAGILTPERRTQCFECHSKRKEQDFVFSSIRP